MNIHQIPSTSREEGNARLPPIQRVTAGVEREGLVVINCDYILAEQRLALRNLEGWCQGYIRRQNYLTMKAQAQLALEQVKQSATYRAYNITNYDAASLAGKQKTHLLTTIDYWKEFAQVFAGQPQELVKKVYVIMPLQPSCLSDADFDEMCRSIRTNLIVVGYPMHQLLDWTQCPNADLLRRNRTYVLPSGTRGPPPQMFGSCYKCVNGQPPPECVPHDIAQGGNHHFTETGADQFILMLKMLDRDGTLLYLNIARTHGFVPLQLNLSVESQHLLDYWRNYGTEEPNWMYEFCCEDGNVPLRRNYPGKRGVRNLEFCWIWVRFSYENLCAKPRELGIMPSSCHSISRMKT